MFVKVYFFFLLANICLTVVDGYAEAEGQTVVANNIVFIGSGSGVGDQPNFFNNTDSTGTLITNFTDTTNSTLVGHSGDQSIFDPITEATDRLFYVGEMIFEILTGNFIVGTMNSITTSIGINFPTDWNFGFQVLIGFINIFFIVYIITARSIPAFS